MNGNNKRIFVATAPVDFRGSFDRLAGFVRAQLNADPRSGAFFVFFNRRADRAKILYFDQTGDCLLYKRLDRGTFRGTLDLDAKGAQIEINAPELERAFRGARQEKLRLH